MRRSLEEMWRSWHPITEDGGAQLADSVGLSFFILAAFNTANDARTGVSEAGFRAIRDSALVLIAR